MSTALWPFAPTNPQAWRALKSRWPEGLDYIGHDGACFYFGEIGNPEPVRVPMTHRAQRIAKGEK